MFGHNIYITSFLTQKTPVRSKEQSLELFGILRETHKNQHA